MRGRVLIVAGSDSGGGAGIQADIKAVTALGGFAMTAITALTAQNTLGVHGVVAIDPAFVARQMAVVLADLGADCIKTGMLHDAAVIAAVVDTLAEHAPAVPLVCDPVMVAKGGHALLLDSAVAALRDRLLPRATVLTPNLPEAEVLLGRPIAGPAAMEQAAVDLRALGPAAVLLKGGHGEGDEVVDVLADGEGLHVFRSARLDTRHTHGTGCTLASAIAAGIAQGLALRPAVAAARDYVWEAIRRAPGFGAGHGPLDHGHTMRRRGG
ncbi:hydroxymethylpyrimidine/phosphomethylpyrimidine kinase [Stella humosa]|uniref:hydroxymethylpyrimidine kinase n=1 Tax=Stella humosa TaxID=94 RepID=A0A3N1LIY7_9PROT|nr:bifunctional hydroxymethylpyrimidine kinase/phosphomethylpyrimidine kinase [Stella humosa]ROP91312.1 hydroxymethylpyrimidine/phosphomethylpyrimidine kinase [Stella humosa]BBK34332.1 hydroxymethylpyrimidine/phosphomethylpyrimidine kinase [Stella humosa]